MLSLNVDEILQPLGQELFARCRVPRELLRLQPAAYQVAECLSYLLHGWQMFLTEKVRRGDDAHFQGGYQICNDRNRKIRANQSSLLQLGNVGIGIAHKLIAYL